MQVAGVVGVSACRTACTGFGTSLPIPFPATPRLLPHGPPAVPGQRSGFGCRRRPVGPAGEMMGFDVHGRTQQQRVSLCVINAPGHSPDRELAPLRLSRTGPVFRESRQRVRLGHLRDVLLVQARLEQLEHQPRRQPAAFGPGGRTTVR